MRHLDIIWMQWKYCDLNKDLTQAIRIDPNNGAHFFHRGCLLREQNPEWAIKDFSIAILLDFPEKIDAYYFRAQMYQHLNQHELAISDYVTSTII